MSGLSLALTLGGCGGARGAAATARSGTTAATTAPALTATTGTTTTILPGTGRPVITLGDKNTPEQFILGELYDQALTAEGFSVTLTRNIGPPSVSLQAAEQGSLDVYPEYLNVWDSQLAGYTKPFASKAAAYGAAAAFATAHSLQLLPPTPGSDTEGLAVLRSYAASDDLRTLRDLDRVAAGITIGVPLVFAQDPMGLPAIEHAYGFQPADVQPVDIGSQYNALRDGTVQAAFVYTTDGQLSQGEFTQLRDPRHILGFGNIVPVVSEQAIAVEGPTFEATINDVDALLTTRTLRDLNAEAHFGDLDPTTIARQFLQAHGLLPPSVSGTA